MRQKKEVHDPGELEDGEHSPSPEPVRPHLRYIEPLICGPGSIKKSVNPVKIFWKNRILMVKN